VIFRQKIGIKVDKRRRRRMQMRRSNSSKTTKLLLVGHQHKVNTTVCRRWNNQPEIFKLVTPNNYSNFKQKVLSKWIKAWKMKRDRRASKLANAQKLLMQPAEDGHFARENWQKMNAKMV
jgi:hypothetical protein